MSLTAEELTQYTDLVIEIKRLEELENQYNLETQKMFEAIRVAYKMAAMDLEIATLADERSIGLREIQDKIESVRKLLIM